MKHSEQLADPATPLNERELDHFKALLLKKRREAEEELEALDDNIHNLMDLESSDYSSSDHHMGDVGSDVEETDLNYKLIERIQTYLRQIDDALERIENKTYGVCQATGKPISIGRLEAVPHTRYSIQAKKEGLDKQQ